MRKLTKGDLDYIGGPERLFAYQLCPRLAMARSFINPFKTFADSSSKAQESVD